MTDLSHTPVRPTPPADWEARYREMILDNRPFDAKIGFFLAYYRTFATPESAAELVRSGEILRRPQKRSYDTAIIIMEIIAGGFDSDRGRAAVEILNRAHMHVKAANEDFLYILLSLMIVPTRWIDAHGSHPVTPLERASAARFYQELGTRMHLRDIPETFDEAVEFYDDFETDRVKTSPDTIALFNATVDVLAQRLPRPARPLTRSILSVLIEDPRMIDALGLRQPSPTLARLIFAVLALRQKLPQSKKPAFRPGRSASRQYPDGYTMNDLGPERATR